MHPEGTLLIDWMWCQLQYIVWKEGAACKRLASLEVRSTAALESLRSVTIAPPP